MADQNQRTTEPACPRVRIMVATHRIYRMPEDSMYLPVLCGAAVDPMREAGTTDGYAADRAKALAAGYQPDDVGDNISLKNPTFCELTGLYWMWRHLGRELEADYIGLVHYRRYFRGKKGGRNDPFGRILTQEELLPLLGTHRVIVPRKRRYVIETLYSHYDHSHYGDHLDRTRRIMETQCPEYVPAFDEVMRERSAHMFNMMIMERALLEEYCAWLFGILKALEKEVHSEGYSYFQGRYAGRVGELIFNVWLRQQVKSGRLSKSEIAVLPYVYVEKANWNRKVVRFLKAKFLHEKYGPL